MKEYFTKCPKNVQFYTNNLVNHVVIFILIELLLMGTITNWSLLSAILLADHRYFKDYL